MPAPVALGKPPPWRSGWEWRMQFGLAWRDKYSVTYGNGGDSRAVRELEDSVLASMPEEELRPLWERRREMFDAFLRASDPVLTQKKHPLSFFVTRFTDYRPDATALEQATEKPCTFHRGARNSGRGAPKADFRHECAECRHVAARAGPRPLAQPKGVAELIAELAAQQGG